MVTIESELGADESPLPTALHVLFGAKRFALASKASWCTERHDREHAATFESWPRIMSERARLRGTSWIEPAPRGATSCVVVYRVEVEVKVRWPPPEQK